MNVEPLKTTIANGINYQGNNNKVVADDTALSNIARRNEQNDHQKKNKAFDREELEKALEKVEKSVDIFNRRLHFKIHDETKRVQVQIIETATDKVLTEIPPEKILELLAAFQEITGMLVDVKV